MDVVSNKSIAIWYFAWSCFKDIAGRFSSCLTGLFECTVVLLMVLKLVDPCSDSGKAENSLLVGGMKFFQPLLDCLAAIVFKKNSISVGGWICFFQM